MFWTDIARFLQYFRNLSNSFLNIFAILHGFNEIFSKYSFNITVLCGSSDHNGNTTLKYVFSRSINLTTKYYRTKYYRTGLKFNETYFYEMKNKKPYEQSNPWT